jgi:hypothetical protein
VRCLYIVYLDVRGGCLNGCVCACHVLVVCVAGVGLVWWVRCDRKWNWDVCVVCVGLIGAHAMKIRLYIPQSFCDVRLSRKVAAWLVCMVWRALLDWYCLTGGGTGLLLVVAAGLARRGIVQK